MLRGILLFLILLFLTTSAVRSQLSTDSSVKVLPHWKKGEFHNVVIKSTTDKFDEQKIRIIDSFNTRFSVIEKDTSGYKIEWVYTSARTDPYQAAIDESILARLIDKKIIVKLSLTGRFKEFLNSEEIKIAADKVVDQLISDNQADSVRRAEFKVAKQLISTTRGLEATLLKQIKFYTLSFGFNYKTKYQQKNTVQFPNPFGQQPLVGTEIVTLAKLDNENNICVIETSKHVDANTVKTEIFGYFKKADENLYKKMVAEYKDKDFEFSESTTQQLDFLKGIVQKANFMRVMNLGVQKRILALDIETVD